MIRSPQKFLTNITLSIIAGFALLAGSISLASEPLADSQFNNPTTVMLIAAKDNKKAAKADKEGVQCKRVRKTGSNRIQRVCTTREQRERASKESMEWQRESQIEQERINAASQDAGSSPN